MAADAAPDAAAAGRVSLQTPVRVETLPVEARENWWHLETQRRLLRLRKFSALWKSKRPEDRAVIEAEREMCRRDICYWIDNYCWTKAPQEKPDPLNPFRGTVPMVLWPRQRLLIRWALDLYHDGNSGIVPKGRETGVSWIMCMVIYWLAWTSRGFRALLISRVRDLVDDTIESDRLRAVGKGGSGSSTDSLFGKLDWIILCQPPWIRPNLELPRHPMQLRFTDNDALITGEATTSGAGAGPRVSIAFVDEVAKIEPSSIQASLWRTLVAGTARCTIGVSSAGNPWARFEQLRKDLAAECVFEVDWSSDPRRDEAWKTRMIAKLGSVDDFLIEHGMNPVIPGVGRIWRPRSTQVLYTEADLMDVEPAARQRWQVFGSWDFGSGPSMLVCFLFLLEFRAGSYRLWLDQEMYWDQEDWQTVADQILDGKLNTVTNEIEGGLRRDYGRYGVHFGDPSGIARESDQNSWITNLQSGGVPVRALDARHNTRDERERQMRLIGAMLTAGTLRIHERCTYALGCVDQWVRQLPKGQTIESASSVYIGPKHDKWSHGGTALCFAAAGILPVAADLLGQGGSATEARTATEREWPASPASFGDEGMTLDSILGAL